MCVYVFRRVRVLNGLPYQLEEQEAHEETPEGKAALPSPSLQGRSTGVAWPVITAPLTLGPPLHHNLQQFCI